MAAVACRWDIVPCCAAVLFVDFLPSLCIASRQTPVKFGSVHTIVRFGAGGQLIKVRPNRPSDNQPTTVEIHSVELLLQSTEEAEDLRSYPGPLSKYVVLTQCNGFGSKACLVCFNH